MPQEETFLTPADNLVAEGIPPIPMSLVEQVGRYTDFRAASLLDFHPTLREMLISTRFASSAQLHLVKMPGGARTQLTFYPDAVGGARFEPTQAQYLVFSKDVGGSEFSQLYRMDMASRDVTLLTDGTSRNTSARFSRCGTKLIYCSTRRTGADGDLWMMDPLQPETDRLVCELKGGGWFPLDFNADGDHVVVCEYVSVNESYLWLLSVQSGDLRLLTPKTGEQVAYDYAEFAPDGRGLWVTSDRGSEFSHLAYLPLDGSSETTLTTHIPWDISEAALSPHGDMIAFIANEDGISKLRLLDTGNCLELNPPTLPVGDIFGLKWSKSTGELGFTMATASSPYDAFSYCPASGEVTRWTESETGGLVTSEYSDAELVRWQSFDSLTISGFLYRPPVRFTGPRPVVVDIHGGPEGQSTPGFLARKNYLLNELGVCILFPNVRGSTGYGKTFVARDNGLKRPDSYRDIGALLDWIQEQPDLDADRVMLTGGSYGGHMTLACATLYADRIACALAEVGMSNLVTFLENTQEYRRDLRRAEYGDERDPEMRAFLEIIAPLNLAHLITKPLFVVQGANDPRVPLSEAEQMVRTVRKNGTPVWYLMAKDEGHGFAKKPNQDFRFYATVLFMREFLMR